MSPPATRPYPVRVLPRSLAARILTAAVVLALAPLGVPAPTAGGSAAGGAASTKPKDPRRTQGLYVDPKMPAYQRGGVYRSAIGSRAQAFWVIPEAYDAAHVRAKVREYVGDAAAARKTPVLTVYGIPGRDCGQYSSNNPLTTAAQYRAWIKRVARGLRGSKSMVILEPDALPFFSSPVTTCPTKPAGWQRMLRFATKRLSRTGAWVYLDAGQSNWTPYHARPRHLKRAGVRFARGISTNVSNFRPTAAERRYAVTLIRGLRRLGVPGKRYVVDTSRNGATPCADGYDVINPTWARLGKRPKLRFRGAFDGTLWVKHPGESDGLENGGPKSGDWSDLLADRLLGRSDGGGC